MRGGRRWRNDDQDSDGYGDPNKEILSCEQPEGTVEEAGDCNDNEASVSPIAAEFCNEVDDDCDSRIDEDAIDAETFYRDQDEDGYGDPEITQDACDPPAGFVADGRDCNDDDPAVNPESVWYEDSDDDRFGNVKKPVSSCEQPPGYVLDSRDCDDTTDRIHPAHDEVCDRLDNNCDDLVDSEDGACELWAGRYGTTFQIRAQEKVGSSVVNDMICRGSGLIVVELSQDPVVQGTFTCSQTRYPVFYETQEAVLTGEVLPDGTFKGELEHGFNDYSTRIFTATGSYKNRPFAIGRGTMKPRAESAVAWDVLFEAPAP